MEIQICQTNNDVPACVEDLRGTAEVLHCVALRPSHEVGSLAEGGCLGTHKKKGTTRAKKWGEQNKVCQTEDANRECKNAKHDENGVQKRSASVAGGQGVQGCRQIKLGPLPPVDPSINQV